MSDGRIKKNIYFVFLGQVFQMALAFILIPFATRYLRAGGFGIYSLATVIMYFVFLFNDLGTNTYVTREVSKDVSQAQRYYSNTLGFKLSFVIINIVLLLLLLKVLNFSQETNIVILIFATYGILTSIVQLTIGIFRAFERMEYETAILILEKAVTTGLGIFVLTKGWGLFAFSGVFVLGGLVSVLTGNLILRKRFCKVKLAMDSSFIKNLIITSLPFGFSLFLSSVYNYISIVLLSIMKSAEVVGWFSAAFKLLRVTNVIPTVLTISLFPALSREVIQSKERFTELFTKGFKYLLFLALPLIIGTTILAKNIALMVFGDEFFNSIIVLRILVWAAGLLFFNIFFAGLYNASNNQKKLVLIQSMGLIINIGLNLLLIPRYAYVGAAIATVITEAVIFISCFFMAYQRIARLQEIFFIVKTLGATCVMLIFLLAFKNSNLFAVIVGSVGLYFLILYLFKGFTLQEVLLLRKQ